jgi:hypothetical protein
MMSGGGREGEGEEGEDAGILAFTFETIASFFFSWLLVNALIIDDLPTFERPENAISCEVRHRASEKALSSVSESCFFWPAAAFPDPKSAQQGWAPSLPIPLSHTHQLGIFRQLIHLGHALHKFGRDIEDRLGAPGPVECLRHDEDDESKPQNCLKTARLFSLALRKGTSIFSAAPPDPSTIL